MSKQSRFRGPFDKRHRKWAETLLKSEQQQLYIFIDPCKAIQSEKWFLSDMKNLRTVC